MMDDDGDGEKSNVFFVVRLVKFGEIFMTNVQFSKLYCDEILTDETKKKLKFKLLTARLKSFQKILKALKEFEL